MAVAVVGVAAVSACGASDPPTIAFESEAIAQTVAIDSCVEKAGVLLTCVVRNKSSAPLPYRSFVAVAYSADRVRLYERSVPGSALAPGEAAQEDIATADNIDNIKTIEIRRQ